MSEGCQNQRDWYLHEGVGAMFPAQTECVRLTQRGRTDQFMLLTRERTLTPCLFCFVFRYW